MSLDHEILAEIPIFALLDEEERRTLAALVELRRFDTGMSLFEYGQAGDELFVMRNGRVQVFVTSDTGEDIILAENGTGRGAWDDVLRYSALGREWGEKIQSQERLCWSRFTMAWAWWGKGDLARAREEAKAGLVDAQRIGESRVGRFLKIVLVQVLADEGEEDEAWRLAKEVHAEAMASDMVTHRSEGHRLYAYLNGRQGESVCAVTERED